MRGFFAPAPMAAPGFFHFVIGACSTPARPGVLGPRGVGESWRPAPGTPVINRDNAPSRRGTTGGCSSSSDLATAVFVAWPCAFFSSRWSRGRSFPAARNATARNLLFRLRLVYARTDGKDDALLDNAPRFSLFYARGGDTVFSPRRSPTELIRRLPEERATLQRKMVERAAPAR